MQRRTFLSSTLALATSASIGCDSSEEASATASSSSAAGAGAAGSAAQGTGQGGGGHGGAGPLVWDIGAPTFVEGASSTFDLAPTLPSGVVPGGTFAVDPSGAPLPSGMTLSPAGLLEVGAAVAGATAGVVFSYTEP